MFYVQRGRAAVIVAQRSLSPQWTRSCGQGPALGLDSQSALRKLTPSVVGTSDI